MRIPTDSPCGFAKPTDLEACLIMTKSLGLLIDSERVYTDVTSTKKTIWTV